MGFKLLKQVWVGSLWFLFSQGSLGTVVADDRPVFEEADCMLALDFLAHIIKVESDDARRRFPNFGTRVEPQELDTLQRIYPMAFVDDEGLTLGFYLGRNMRGTSDFRIVIEQKGSDAYQDTLRYQAFVKAPLKDSMGRTIPHLTVVNSHLKSVYSLPRRRPAGTPLVLDARIDRGNAHLLREGDSLLLYVMDDPEPMYYRFVNHDISGNLVLDRIKMGSTTGERRVISPSVFDKDGFAILDERGTP